MPVPNLEIEYLKIPFLAPILVMSSFLKSDKFKKSALAISLLAILILLGLPFVWGVDRVPPRVTLMGKKISGVAFENLKVEVGDKIKAFYQENVYLVYAGGKVKVDLGDLGISINGSETAEKLAESLGSKSSYAKKIMVFWESIFFGFKAPLYYDFKISELEGKIKKEYKVNFFESRDAAIVVENDLVKVTPAVKGFGIDEIFLSAQVIEFLKSGTAGINNEIEVRAVELEPGISTDEAEKMKAKIEDMIAYPYVFRASDYERKIPKEVILSWLRFEKKENDNLEIAPQNQNFKEITNISLSGKSFMDSKNRYVLSLEVDEESIKKFLEEEIKNKIFREKKDGVLTFEENQIKEKVPSQSEINIDEEKALQMAVESFRNKNYFISLPVKEVYPNLSLGKIKELGIDNLVAQGESNFTGSPTNRRHNIRVGASKFNGIVIPKDEEFSFVTTLGPVDASTGYLPELVIKKDKTIPEYGGGMCQVSSTAFRAAVKAGLRVTERQNHAYPVQYYSPQGTDATVYIPKPDLKFVNNTPGPILIQTRMEGNLLFFDFFGNSDGRRVELAGPRVWDKKSDGSMKTEWIQKVFDKDGKMLFEKSFLSKYDSPSKYPHPEDEKPPTDKKKKKKN